MADQYEVPAFGLNNNLPPPPPLPPPARAPEDVDTDESLQNGQVRGSGKKKKKRSNNKMKNGKGKCTPVATKKLKKAGTKSDFLKSTKGVAAKPKSNRTEEIFGGGDDENAGEPNDGSKKGGINNSNQMNPKSLIAVTTRKRSSELMQIPETSKQPKKKTAQVGLSFLFMEPALNNSLFLSGNNSRTQSFEKSKEK